MVTTKTNTHADPLLGSRWAQMWAYMWAEQLVIFWYMLPKVTYTLFTMDPKGQLDILRHTGHAFHVNSLQVGVLKQSNKEFCTPFL